MLSISFSGGSWIGAFYYYGVIKYLMENDILNQEIITLGASAGSFAATMLLYVQYIMITKRINILPVLRKKLFKFTESLPEYPMMISKKLTKFLKNLIPYDPHFINFIRNKLFISITENKFLYLKNILENPKSYDDLIKNLIQSSMVPFFMDIPFKFLDGGFTNNQPVYNENTLKINCLFEYKTHIHPSEKTNLIYLYKKPSLKIRNKLIKMGYNDTRNYFEADL